MNSSSCVPRKRKSVNTMLTSSLTKRKVHDCLDDAENTTAMRTDHSALRLQFFVRILSDHSHVLRADPQDTIRTIHEKIQSITGIPVTEQRLIYRGKQLRWDQTLAAAGVQNDAVLHLVGRIRSTEHRQACWLVDDLVSHLFSLPNNKPSSSSSKNKTVASILTEFIAVTPDDPEKASAHLQFFSASSAPAALVMLHISADESNRHVADDAIKLFLYLPKKSYPKWVPIVLNFCKLLSRFAGKDDPLYGLCRSRLGTMVECCTNIVGLGEVFPFVSELAAKLSKDMDASTTPSMSEIKDFASFIVSVRNGIKGEYLWWLPFEEEKNKLQGMFMDLLSKLKLCLVKKHVVGGRQCLALLKVLNSISKLCPGCEKVFWESMKQRKTALCSLVVSCVESGDDHSWISECKEVTTFEARRHLAMMLVPDGGGYNHEMLIDRANLLAESFEYILNADLDSLRAGLRMEFKDEVATGPGVLREWFLLVCQEIFNPDKNPLFVACPDDRTRFFPNPASSSADPLDCFYFNFAGKVIALALKHQVQVGIVFDSVFFQQLAERKITLEDVKDADPLLYRSCKQILEMDAETVDRDDLGLTFVHEIEELGTRRVVKLCPGGKSVVVNSDNRRQYVDSLIQHLFVKQTAQKVEYFAEGFGDILNSRELKKSFFRCLDPEDLELMLRGSGDEISVDDWKAHTDYNGFKATDEQIKWFWEIVGNMTKEEKMVLLFFWTSIKYLPSQGFGGLASRPYISKTSESCDRLPSSHTCFYGLCFPAYPTMRVMRKRLRIITQEHVSCSFGTQ